MLVAEEGQAESNFIVYTVMQHDYFFLKGLQGKAESGIFTLHGDVEYSSLYKTADVHGEKVAELQRKVRYSEMVVVEI